MKTYVDYNFYTRKYLLGRTPKIPDAEFAFWAMQASEELRRATFERVDNLEDIPEDVQMCCCEVAEKLYVAEAVKEENGMILQSYGNDGETGTYKVSELTETAVQKSVSKIIRKWLAHTGLMYCGVG